MVVNLAFKSMSTSTTFSFQRSGCRKQPEDSLEEQCAWLNYIYALVGALTSSSFYSWELLPDPEAAAPKAEPGLSNLYDEIRVTVGQEAQIITAVFPNPAIVMQVFLQRVFAQVVRRNRLWLEFGRRGTDSVFLRAASHRSKATSRPSSPLHPLRLLSRTSASFTLLDHPPTRLSKTSRRTSSSAPPRPSPPPPRPLYLPRRRSHHPSGVTAPWVPTERRGRRAPSWERGEWASRPSAQCLTRRWRSCSCRTWRARGISNGKGRV